MVQSTEKIPPQFESSLRESDFIEVVRLTGDVSKTIARLSDLRVEFVLAGCELAVELADRLADGLCTIGNGTTLSAARRDKHLMIESVRRHGLTTPAQLNARDHEDVLEWARCRGLWPIVLKPLASTSSDTVRLCWTEDEVGRAVESILGRVNVLGTVNDRVLAQEFLDGPEYVVDTVSFRGQHRVAGIWRYVAPVASRPTVGYDAMILLTGEGERQELLFHYASQVLDALKIEYGPAHCELKWVDGEPVLVEIGARLSAGINCWINRLCGGICQLDLTLDAYLSPERFTEGLGTRYSLHKHTANVFLKPPCGGRLKGLPRLPELRALESLYRMSVSATIGEPVPPVAGIVTLLHPDEKTVEADRARTRELETDGLYDVEAIR